MQKSDQYLRGFEPVKWAPKDADIVIPERATKGSAGYDIHSPISFTIFPGEVVKVDTYLKAFMPEGEHLQIHVRSSVGDKGLMITSVVGIVDSDYYGCQKNDGNIIIKLRNIGTDIVDIQKGEAIAQGIFIKYYKTSDDSVTRERVGGYGSTGK